MNTTPSGDAETQAFWTAANEGSFLIKSCVSCGKAHWYPRSHCPFCAGETVWQQASGAGSVYSYSIVPNAPAETRVIAFVTLAEGPTMMTNVIDTPLDELRIGLPVQLVFTETGTGQAIPRFRSAEAAASSGDQHLAP